MSLSMFVYNVYYLVGLIVKTIDIAPIILQVFPNLYHLQLFSFLLIFSIYGSHEKPVTGEFGAWLLLSGYCQ